MSNISGITASTSAVKDISTPSRFGSKLKSRDTNEHPVHRRNPHAMAHDLYKLVVDDS